VQCETLGDREGFLSAISAILCGRGAVGTRSLAPGKLIQQASLAATRPGPLPASSPDRDIDEALALPDCADDKRNGSVRKTIPCGTLCAKESPGFATAELLRFTLAAEILLLHVLGPNRTWILRAS